MQRLKGSIDSRPLLKGKTEQELLQYITDKLTERELFYNKAKLCIATDTLGPEEVIEKIIDLGLSLPAQFIGARLKPNKNK
jgi:shikimate kinase